ncbi:MAG: hypothetical protein A2Z14_00730 [Chloroflexi bacterium RBG_16_48_8]|nr:MAG: hypothetical protein A2Z14_00730 [Chloroflexi bacterium RBG_16_48_8]
MAFTVNLGVPFDTALEKVNATLKDEGVGVLTKIDVRETIEQKFGEDFRPYVILSASNTPLSHRALSNLPEVGIILPCNVSVEKRDADVFISSANPETMIMLGEHEEDAALREVAAEARARLDCVAQSMKP